MDKVLEVLKQNDVEITEGLKNQLQDAVTSGDGEFTQEDIDNAVEKRLAREKEKHKKELEQKDKVINELNEKVEDLIDPEKVEEYQELVEEKENQLNQQTTNLTLDYELKLAAKDKGVQDIEYFEFLAEKRGIKNKLTVSDGEIAVTDAEGNVLTNDNGEKYGPKKLIDDMAEDKPQLLGDNGVNVKGRTPNKANNNEGQTNADNPFKDGQANLTKQGKLVKNEPDKAKRLIKAAGKDPSNFNL